MMRAIVLVVVVMTIVMKVEGLSLASLKNQFPKLSNTSGYFWQITDPHLDSEYVVGSVANCGQLVCCRKNSPRTNGVSHQCVLF